ncbi:MULTISPECIES: alpha/beta hydrolase [unclassified Rhizobium]|uniref:alpha/beta fold hydrolase n=1 Tax=unclassified Rhizobium TaxID=2613769 RepID=UPI00161E2BEF|nr:MULTISPECIES: alpha/beta hydrolase [unclassified Rhizobium]MBB3290031.1 pimeloyl-ACP methyl ester carboxylesterase [Rhizobium sp. BK252]MBB3404813.1 pimeloyl-ACP methyl ester carboxylesterase [Rhizobium sp. BK289]MBB3417309.1 pimeloyl-ACP methyl ester carboxylesterase [Rhizobium sp. BK284]MBB3485388.1 pimeloyl-ACP methyl ester carboxylesterase [Rhizobium sp. BK347]
MFDSLLAAIVLLLAIAAGFSAYKTRAIEQTYPNIGELTDIGGYRLNAVHLPRPATADLPALVFIHGASGNLRDQFEAFAAPLRGRAEMLFVDRPGHGYSERGTAENALPSGQADAIARLMDGRGIKSAIIIGHSFGGAIAAAFGMRHPEKTAGLLFLAPATHPWSGGVDWYYTLAAMPVLGWLFTQLFVIPIGLRRVDTGTLNIFHPNARPADYVMKTAPELVLRPRTFRNNAIDVVNLFAYVSTHAPRYSEIKAPTVIITGDSDDIVLEELHSRGLAQDIAGAKLITIRNLGHKPDYVTTDVAIAAIEHLGGQPRDLEILAAEAEIRIANLSKEPSKSSAGSQAVMTS